MRIELTFVIPCSAVHVFTEAAMLSCGGCTVDQTPRYGTWSRDDGSADIEPVRAITVGIPVTAVRSTVLGLAASLGMAGERSMYVSHAGTGLAFVVRCNNGRLE